MPTQAASEVAIAYTPVEHMLEQLIEMFHTRFDDPIKAIAISDPYYTELLMEGLVRASITPRSYLFIGRGVRWNSIPIIYTNEPGVQVITQKSYETMKDVNGYLLSRPENESIDDVIDDIDHRGSNSLKAAQTPVRSGHLEMFA